MPRVATTLGFAVFAGALQANAAPVVHAETSGRVEALILPGSQYGTSLRATDHAAPVAGPRFSLRHLFALRHALRVGPTLGYAFVSAPYSPTPDAAPAIATPAVHHHLLDAGVAVRWIVTDPMRAGLRFDVEAAAGAAAIVRVWNGTTDAAAVPWLEASLGLGSAAAAERVFWTLRVGGVYMPWRVTGSLAWDPAFAGVFVGGEFGGAR